MKRFNLLAAVLFLLLMGCSSVHLETTYKNPDIVLFHSNKLLVVGMTRETQARQAFETQLREVFTKAGVETMRSIDLFDVDFTEYERTEQELDQVERQLLDKDFDAILLTKVIDSRTRTTLRRKIREVGEAYDHFREDYLLHQGIYYDRDTYESITDYFAETSLYCICEGKERNLIWRSNVLISDPKNQEKAIRDYIRLIREEMEKNQLILGTDIF